ncbi:DEAD/DEAH box helicase [Brevibacterium daeguense]|uniref:DEAD/DEAH box helicase n=1 Tax=Brevibacterium daeguense TaxID=909936 RepID=A0ABP8EFN7_9MICO|nr:DEAD/DEAH box helicase [Brevibacterium daeguense]
MNELVPGLHETLIDQGLNDVLRHHPALNSRTSEVDSADSPHSLAVHLTSRIAQSLEALRPEQRVGLANRLLAQLPEADPRDELVEGPQLLTDVFELDTLPPRRPSTPLSDVALLTNSPHDPQLASELRLEMASADRIELLCSFVKWSGIRLIEESLNEARRRNVPIRVLTTTYIGATERKALDRLVREFNAEVKVNYDFTTTHLHAKAWLFHRKTGYDTAYVGSSNLSRAALLDGLEWNVRISQVATPALMDKFQNTFDSYWASENFDEYRPDRDGERLDRALALGSGSTASAEISISNLDVRPFPHQKKMLDELEAERVIHGRHKNLLVAATGTGKTVVAALDYQRFALEAGKPPRLLFVAHRKEILDQARRTYCDVLKDGSFGELMVDGAVPQVRDHVFASVASLSRENTLDQWDPKHFDVVVIDEFHHASAPTYRRILNHFDPEELLGLTATPERADGRNVAVDFFDGKIASELRLWEALESQLLAPFHYFGLSDGTDLRALRFQRGRYDVNELSNLYTGNTARTAKILAALADKVVDPTKMRALGFCVSVDHAHYMAQQFTRAGIASVALSGESTDRDRTEGLQKLKRGEVACIFTVDLFNEGVDIPEVDTVIMLRPTQSATIFLQQLGRGLRKALNKSVLTVLDFVGHQHKDFRFDIKLRALTGLSRRRLVHATEQGFPFLPPGSQIVLDRVAREEVLGNLKSHLQLTTKSLISDIREHKPPNVSVADYQLADYLHESDRSLPDIYSPSNRTFAGDKRAATWLAVRDWAFPQNARIDYSTEDLLLRRARSLTHVDDPARIAAYRRLLTTPRFDSSVLRDPFAAMLYYSLYVDGSRDRLVEGMNEIAGSKAMREELLGLLDVLEASARNLPRPLSGHLEHYPLKSHARYSREELLAGLGIGTVENGTPRSVREGVKWIEAARTDVLLVTLQKSEADYSPTTLYRDFAINERLFHWESQSTTRAESRTGRRYISHDQEGSQVVLFVRRAKNGDIGIEPYTCLGIVHYRSHQGSRPMQITWELDRAMPPDLFLEARAVA